MRGGGKLACSEFARGVVTAHAARKQRLGREVRGLLLAALVGWVLFGYVKPGAAQQAAPRPASSPPIAGGVVGREGEPLDRGTSPETTAPAPTSAAPLPNANWLSPLERGFFAAWGQHFTVDNQTIERPYDEERFAALAHRPAPRGGEVDDPARDDIETYVSQESETVMTPAEQATLTRMISKADDAAQVEALKKIGQVVTDPNTIKDPLATAINSLGESKRIADELVRRSGLVDAWELQTGINERRLRAYVQQMGTLRRLTARLQARFPQATSSPATFNTAVNKGQLTLVGHIGGRPLPESLVYLTIGWSVRRVSRQKGEIIGVIRELDRLPDKHQQQVKDRLIDSQSALRSLPLEVVMLLPPLRSGSEFAIPLMPYADASHVDFIHIRSLSPSGFFQAGVRPGSQEECQLHWDAPGSIDRPPTCIENVVTEVRGPAVPKSGYTMQWTVTLSRPAPATGSVVTLTSPDPLVNVPPKVRVPGGSRSATFDIRLNYLVTPFTQFSASYGGETVHGFVGYFVSNVVLPLSTVSPLESATIRVGETALLTLNLNAEAPPGGLTVLIFVRGQFAPPVTFPNYVVVPAGSRTATFPMKGTSRGIGFFTAGAPNRPGINRDFQIEVL